MLSIRSVASRRIAEPPDSLVAKATTMKCLYLGICLFAVPATIRLASDFTHSLTSQKELIQTALDIQGNEITDATRDPAAKGLNSAAAEDASGQAMTAGTENAESQCETEAVSTRIAEEPESNSFVSAIKNSPSVRHHASQHETMITPGNFEYLGAVRPPHIAQNGTGFAYGGWGVAYRADGDPNGPDDGCPGSLFLVGHQSHQMVAEISIPAPVNSKYQRADELPVAEILQPFDDITDGLLEEMTDGSSEHFRLGGLLVTDNQLHWTMFKYYNVANIDYLSHGTSGLDMKSAPVEGPWHLGPMNSRRPEWNSYKHAGYIFEIPPAEATQWFGGRNLISGLQISTGLQASSQGPAMFAYSLPPEGTPRGACLSAIPLVWYSEQEPITRHHPSDRWTGGAWLTLGNKQAVVIVGRKALGEFYYGEARPQDCNQDKGYHGPPYEVEMFFYSPASLIHAANGALPAQGLSPWMRWDCLSEGGGLNQYMFDTCGKHVGGLAYDRHRNLLYLVQVDAGTTSDNEYEPLPVIHVFRITDRN